MPYLLAIPAPEFADVVWPALYLEARLFSWWAIGIGPVAEYLFVRRLFSLPFERAAVARVSANAVSTVAGVVLIPLAGILWEIFPGSVYMPLLNWSTFNPVTWGATFLMACLINTIIESLVYKRGFGFSVRWRALWWVLSPMPSA